MPKNENIRVMSYRDVKVQKRFSAEIKKRQKAGEYPKSISRSFIEEQLIKQWLEGSVTVSVTNI